MSATTIIDSAPLGARKSFGWTSSHEWLAAALNGEDIDAFCNGASAVNG